VTNTQVKAAAHCNLTDTLCPMLRMRVVSGYAQLPRTLRSWGCVVRSLTTKSHTGEGLWQHRHLHLSWKMPYGYSTTSVKGPYGTVTCESGPCGDPRKSHPLRDWPYLIGRNGRKTDLAVTRGNCGVGRVAPNILTYSPEDPSQGSLVHG